MIELIPNCSESVGRIALTSDDVIRLRAVLKLMSKGSNLHWDYFEEYLTGAKDSEIFMGDEEQEALREALNLIGKGDVDASES